MALAQVTAGNRAITTDVNQFYNLLKGVSGSGESVTFIYNAAGALIFQPSSDPAAGTELFQIKNNAGTRQIALTSDGKIKFADGTLQSTAAVTFTGGTLTSALVGAKSANIASATTTDLSTATGNEAHITGTTTITGFGTVTAGTIMRLIFDGALKVTYNATSMILDGATDFYAQAGDHLDVVSEGSGNWKEVGRGYGTAAARYVTANLGGDVTMTTANTYYDGPSISLGAGVWLIVGAVLVWNNGAGPGNATVKLWDGTTVAASGGGEAFGTTAQCSIPVSAIVTLTATTTYKISAVSDIANSILRAASPYNGAGNNASHIRAVRLF